VLGGNGAHGRPDGGVAPTGGQERKAAQRDAGQDGRTAEHLMQARRVAEQDDPRYRAHERLKVEERPGHLSGHPALPIGEERKRRQGAAERQPGAGQERS
jgi:hypothetical protein